MALMTRALAGLLLAFVAAGDETEEISLLQTSMDPIQVSIGHDGEPTIVTANKSATGSLNLERVVPEVQPDNTFHHDFIDDGHPTQAPAPAETVTFHLKYALAEFVAMTLFVVVGCGSAMAIAKEEGSAWVLQVALAFGFAITVLAFSIGRYSGGQINCAVTFGLWAYGSLPWDQAVANFIGQVVGSIVGAILLCIVFPKDKDKTGGLGTNAIADGYNALGVLVGEFVMTFVLMMVVFESGEVTGSAAGIKVLPIGLAVFLAHCVLIPIDGCSINPTRSLGPAILCSLRDGKADPWKDMWVFWVGPLLGALAAAGMHALFVL